MRRVLWLLPVLFIAIFVLRRVEKQTDQTPLALRIAERFGKTNLRYTTTDGRGRLELTLSDKRWNGMDDIVPDSARVIARYALDDLMGLARPDTIVVMIQTSSEWGGLVTGSSGVHLATADL